MIKITIPTGGLNQGEVLSPIDPPPPLRINDYFELEFLRASATRIYPFSQIQIEWSIAAKEGVVFDDFTFSLVLGTGEQLEADIAPTGATNFAPYRNVGILIVGRYGEGRGTSMLGNMLSITVDESRCRQLEIEQSWVDDLAINGLSQLTGANAELRLRRTSVPKPGGGWELVEREVIPTWNPGVIRYYFPLEIVINNFFNADFDVTLEIRFAVHHNDADDLLVNINHSSDVDFDTIENILSLGHSHTAAETANRLLPMILDCRARAIEAQIARQVLALLESMPENHRLFAVRIIVEENVNYIAIITCPQPEIID